MKRLISMILAALCVCATAPAALATDRTYELPEFNMTIEAPEGWIVFTRDFDEDDPNLELFGLDGKELTNVFKDYDICLCMVKTDPFAQIYLTVKDFDDQGIYDFNNMSDEELLQFMGSAMEVFSGYIEGPAYTVDSVYKHKQAKFVVFDGVDSYEGAMMCQKQYATVINGQEIIITLQSFGSEVSDSLAQTLKDIVDSIYFTEVKSRPSTSRLSALLYVVMDIAIVGGIVWLIIYLVRKGRNKRMSPPGLGGRPGGLGI